MEKEEDNSSEGFEQQAYPLPDKKKPLKVSGSALESIILNPKKEQEEELEEQEEEEAPSEENNMTEELEKQIEVLTADKTGLEEQLEEQKKKVEELESKVNERDESDRKSLAQAIADERIDKKLLSEDNKEKTVESLSQLSKCQLDILLEDVKNLQVPEAEEEEEENEEENLENDSPDPKAKDAGDELTDDEQKMSALRKEMFGHEEQVDVWLSKRGD